ncbi:MAG: acyltransferase [Planctomycetaceae bacterium]
MMNYSQEELRAFGFKRLGNNVRIHRTAFIAGHQHISLGDNSRIDCFSLISAAEQGVDIGSHVHIAAGCYLFGGGGRIVMEDFSGLSSRVALYTATDDYSGGAMTNPTVPDEFRNVKTGDVILRKHAIVGAGCVILPGVELKTGAAIGALTCVRKDVKEFSIQVGNLHRPETVGKRGRDLLELEERCRNQSKEIDAAA